MIRRAILAAIAWIALATAALAQTPPTTLNFPALTGRVVDEAGLLTSADQTALTDNLAALEAKTTDQLVVVTLKSLRGTTIEDYGYQLGRAWGIGQKPKDNGALLIVAPAEHKVRIEVGYGLEGALTDAATRTIIDSDILPRFKANDFPGGIKAGVADIESLLAGEPATTQPAPSLAQTAPGQSFPASSWPVIGFGFAGLALLVLCLITGGWLCRMLMQVVFFSMLFGRGGGSNDRPSFSGGGGSFGGGGSSGSW